MVETLAGRCAASDRNNDGWKAMLAGRCDAWREMAEIPIGMYDMRWLECW
jgi:hypothetical protein